MGLTGQPTVEVWKRIIPGSSYEGLATQTEPVIRLCVYFRPSRRGRISIVSEQVMQIDCHVPAAKDYVAYRVAERLNQLLNEQKVGSQILHYDGFLGELPTATGFFCAGIRFSYQNII